MLFIMKYFVLLLYFKTIQRYNLKKEPYSLVQLLKTHTAICNKVMLARFVSLQRILYLIFLDYPDVK